MIICSDFGLRYFGSNPNPIDDSTTTTTTCNDDDDDDDDDDEIVFANGERYQEPIGITGVLECYDVRLAVLWVHR